MEAVLEDHLLTSLRHAYAGKDWFYDVGYDQYGRVVLYINFECHETIWDIPDKLEGKQVLVHFAASAPNAQREFVNKPQSKYIPMHVPMSEVIKELGDPITWDVEDAEYEKSIRQASPDTEEQDQELERRVQKLTEELDRLEKICGTNILADIFFEENDQVNAITNLSAKFPQVREKMHQLYQEYGFEILYNELEL